MSVKFGLDQVNSPAPRGYRNFRRAWNALIAPAIASGITGWGLPDAVFATRLLLVLTFLTAIVNAVDVYLGSDDVIVNEKDVRDGNIG